MNLVVCERCGAGAVYHVAPQVTWPWSWPTGGCRDCRVGSPLLLLLDRVLMDIDEVLAQVLWGPESSSAVGAGMVVNRRLVHGGDVLLQVIKVTDHLVADWTRARNLPRGY